MNKVTLLGRLTKDVVTKTVGENNLSISNFTLAVNRTKKGEADFLPVVALGKVSEICERFLKKGSQVVIVGRIQTRSWEDKSGVKQYTTEISAEEVHFVAGNKEVENKKPTSSEDDEFEL